MSNIFKDGLLSEASPKLKQGPKNPNHKLYQHNHQLIYQALFKRLPERCVNIKASDLYNDAGLTVPTFYLHFRNSNDVLVSYETGLETALSMLIPSKANRRDTFLLLTAFIIKHQQYFLAVNERKDYHALAQLVNICRVNLVGDRVSDELFMIYTGKVVIVLSHWLTYQQLDSQTAKRCVEDLVTIRIGKVW